MTVRPAEKKRYDALVIGSGAAGSMAVKELTERGLDVLLLEAGRDITEADFQLPATTPEEAGISALPRLKAALRGQPVQARRAFFKSEMSPFLVHDRDNPYSTPRGQPFLWIRGRVLGGRLHTYGRMLLRMSDYDFQGASMNGRGTDWPITYTDVKPYYDRVESFLGLHGNADGIPHLPDGKYAAPATLTDTEQDFKDKVEQRWPGRRVIAWRSAAPTPHRLPLGIVAARKTGRLTTFTDAVVTRITVDQKSGNANGVEFTRRLTKERGRAHADVVVLCASTIESVRLLLNSACSRHPNGLGNSSGLLGRYFMDQTPSLVFGLATDVAGAHPEDEPPAVVDPFSPPVGGIYIPRWENLDGNSHPDFATGFAFQGAMGRHPVPGGFGLMGFGEMLPNRENQVTLAPRRTDAWGVPIPQIRCAMSHNERAMLREQVRAVIEMVEHSGFETSFAGSALGLEAGSALPGANPLAQFFFRWGLRKSLALGAAIHECGGARMGSDPATSVLNEHSQCWDVPNLFVTDGSGFVTSGVVGPTLTIMALTARACDYISN